MGKRQGGGKCVSSSLGRSPQPDFREEGFSSRGNRHRAVAPGEAVGLSESLILRVVLPALGLPSCFVTVISFIYSGRELYKEWAFIALYAFETAQRNGGQVTQVQILAVREPGLEPISL